MSEQKTEAKPELVDVELAQTHNHAGVDHPAGAVISVSPDTATWLEANKIGGRAGPGGRRIVAPKPTTPILDGR